MLDNVVVEAVSVDVAVRVAKDGGVAAPGLIRKA